MNTMYRVIKNDCQGFNLVLQMQPHAISFYGVTSRIGFMFLLFPQVSRNMKVRIRTAIETITADRLQTVWNELDYRVDVCRITKGEHIEHLLRYVTKAWSVALLNEKIRILLSQLYCV